MTVKIALVGPTFTGKTTLANQIADHFHAILINDFMDEYSVTKRSEYTREDLISIAHGQSRLEDLGMMQADDVIISDTTLLKLKIWSEFKFGACDPWILTEVGKRHYDYYLLLNTDINGVYNHPVEQPTMRDFFLSSFENYLRGHELPYAKITGTQEDRLKNALGVLYNNNVV